MRDSFHTHSFFRFLVPEQVEAALDLIALSQHARGEFLFHAGDQADCIYLLFAGLVKKTYINVGGEEKIISLHQAGDIFGELFLGKYPYRIGTAVVVEQALVGRLTKTNLMILIERLPATGLNLISHLADEQRETLARLHALMHIDARHRLLGTLLSLSRRANGVNYDGWIELPSGITQDDIASIACLNRSTVNVLINQLRAQQVLGGKGRLIRVNPVAVEGLLRQAGLEILE